MIGKVTEVWKQFLIIDNEPIQAFINKGTKFTDCESYTEITSNVVCKKVAGLVNLDLSASTKKIHGEDCQYIKIAGIVSNSGCDSGDKFVIKQVSGVRKQFLIMNNEPILAFVNKGKKFTACDSYTEITSSVVCKEVSGLANVDLSASAAPSPTSAAPSPTSAAPSPTSAAPSPSG